MLYSLLSIFESSTLKPAMASKLVLYYAAGSPLARAILLLARYMPLDIELKHVDLIAGEQRSEAITKLNPLQKIPILVDGDFVLCESRAILAYLVNSRKPGSDLYPADPKIRALVDQRLYYDATVVFEKFSALVVSFIRSQIYAITSCDYFNVKTLLAPWAISRNKKNHSET